MLVARFALRRLALQRVGLRRIPAGLRRPAGRMLSEQASKQRTRKTAEPRRKVEREREALTILLQDAKSAEAVLRVHAEHMQAPGFTSRHLSRCWFVLSTDAAAKAAGHADASLADLREHSVEALPRMAARDVVSIARSVEAARVGCASPWDGLWSELAAAATKLAPKITVEDIAYVAKAFASTGHVAPPLFHALEDAAVRRVPDEAVRPKVLASLCWSFSHLDHAAPALFAAVGEELSLRPDEWAVRELALTAWAFAAADVTSSQLFDAAFARRCEGALWHPATLCQLHQWAMWREDRGQPVALTSELRSRALDAFCSAPVAPSALQQLVAESLGDLGPREEVRLPCGYTLDMVVQFSNTEVGIEVDGPAHFFGFRQVTGATALKRRQLRKRGVKLLSLPYWELDLFDGLEPAARREAIRALVHERLEKLVGKQIFAYRTLDLLPAASLEEIKRACAARFAPARALPNPRPRSLDRSGPHVCLCRWKALALAEHPDRNQGSGDATARMAEINSAYVLLSFEHRKREGAARRHTARGGKTKARRAEARPAPQPMQQASTQSSAPASRRSEEEEAAIFARRLRERTQETGSDSVDQASVDRETERLLEESKRKQAASASKRKQDEEWHGALVRREEQAAQQRNDDKAFRRMSILYHFAPRLANGLTSVWKTVLASDEQKWRAYQSQERWRIRAEQFEADLARYEAENHREVERMLREEEADDGNGSFDKSLPGDPLKLKEAAAAPSLSAFLERLDRLP